MALEYCLPCCSTVTLLGVLVFKCLSPVSIAVDLIFLPIDFDNILSLISDSFIRIYIKIDQFSPGTCRVLIM